MRSRSDDIRRRIEKRKRERERYAKNIDNRVLWTTDEDRYGMEKFNSYEGGPDDGHPLFKKEIFIMKILASACVFLVVAIMFRNQAPAFDPARNFVKSSMEQDFQFAAVSEWYEKQFGKPLAILPFSDKEEEKKQVAYETEYALPASGKILENFNKNGQSITIETEKGAAVEAMSEGMVRFAGNKEGFGKTVIIQHADKSESWYGNLDEIKVNLYEYIEKGASVGTASNGEEDVKGEFYFAIKKGDDFIDPIQVIQFD